MARSLVLSVMLAFAALAPSPAPADAMYSFLDEQGVYHFTNVPQDKRYRRVPGRTASTRGVYRITLGSRAPPLLRRTTAYDEHILAAAERYGLAPPLLKAVMAVESNFDPHAVSVKGATGLMQLMPGTARDLYVGNLFDPAQNIDGGARYLRMLQDQFGNDLEKVLAAYNAGPEAVRRAGGGIPRIPETQSYVRRVLALYEQYLKGT